LPIKITYPLEYSLYEPKAGYVTVFKKTYKRSKIAYVTEGTEQRFFYFCSKSFGCRKN